MNRSIVFDVAVPMCVAALAIAGAAAYWKMNVRAGERATDGSVLYVGVPREDHSRPVSLAVVSPASVAGANASGLVSLEGQDPGLAFLDLSKVGGSVSPSDWFKDSANRVVVRTSVDGYSSADVVIDDAGVWSVSAPSAEGAEPVVSHVPCFTVWVKG